MKISNRYLSIACDGGVLQVAHRELGRTLKLAWPAVAIRQGGKDIQPGRALGPARKTRTTISQSFECDDLTMTVSVELSPNRWFWKTVDVVSHTDRPTPDYLQMDRQALVPDRLKRCGYVAGGIDRSKKSDEECGGSVPGCGYPLIGKALFFGLEHPAAFSAVEPAGRRESVRLWHHPVWLGRRLASVREVIGWARDAEANFADYLDTIRLPVLKRPQVCFGTFWSDPYLGDDEYQVSFNAIKAFIDGFERLVIRPDFFTLDAGWQDRQSILGAKKTIGGDRGLAALRRILNGRNENLSLWVTHNGHVGIAPDYLKKRGYEVGAGPGIYAGDGYGVLLDERLERALTARLTELAGRIKVGHFKIDWDNDCATNDRFRARYPTVNHVRQASIDAMIRIGRTMRKSNPRVIFRNGWWPSPWWLAEANHVWLSDSGDSEFCSLPSRTPRDAAVTHRDLMYYNLYRRDRSPIPLDCLDHHELPDAPRNPFANDPVAWTNALWMCFMRGSTYIPFTLMPESLDDWQVQSLQAIMQFCRQQAKHIFVSRGKMVLGNPGKGEIYGFVQPGDGETWCAFRNPMPIPQRMKIDFAALTDHPVRSRFQFYPHGEHLKGDGELTFLAHEVKIVILSTKSYRSPFDCPYMISRQNGKYLYHLPGSVEYDHNVKPLGHPTQRVSELECLESTCRSEKNGQTFWWHLATPHRMRQLELQVGVEAKDTESITVRAFASRYAGQSQACVLPVTRIPPGIEGYGERKNPAGCEHGVYFTMAVPDGGRFGLTLVVSGKGVNRKNIRIWLAGYEAPSRTAVTGKTPFGPAAKGLPFQHPLGFGRCLQLN